MNPSIVLQAASSVDVPLTVYNMALIALGIAVVAALVIGAGVAIRKFIEQSDRDDFDDQFRAEIDRQVYMTRETSVARIEEAALRRAAADIQQQLNPKPS